MQITHLTQNELAARWGYKPATLRKWRVQGQGPKYLKFSRRKVLYPLDEIERYERERLQASTSEDLK